MTLIALGLNHHTAPVAVRERATISEDRLDEALRALREIDAVNEAAIVSTCNRTELYCGVRDPDPAPILAWMREWMRLDAATLARGVVNGGAGRGAGGNGPDAAPGASPAARHDGPGNDAWLFGHADLDAVVHLMRVASGLDSMVLGEPQILGQIKRAYRDATQAGTVGAELSPLFQTAFSVAKQVRTETDIGTNPVSVAFAAVSLARQIFADFSKHTALLVGAGETVQLAARHLQRAGIGRILVANRTIERAAAVADEVGGEAMPLGDIAERLHEADLVIASTASPVPIIGRGSVGSAQKKRRYKPMLIVDIAVPRDVEPEVADLDSVFLYTVDDLRGVIDENRRSREAAAVEAEAIVAHQARRFMRRLGALGATDTIREYREGVEAVREEALERATRMLLSGKPADVVMEQLSRTLANKLMHGPSARIREAAEHGEHELVANARRLLGLEMPRRGPDA